MKLVTPLRSALALVLAALAACSETPRATASAPPMEPRAAPEVVLVRKLAPDGAGHAAAGGGVLTLDNGCLFMAHRDGSRTLLLWPAGTRLERSRDGELRVLPGGPGHAVRVGEEISVGGSELWGEGDDSQRVGPGRPMAADAAFPPGCTGRVWNIYSVEPGPPAELPVPNGRWASTADGAVAWADRAGPRLVLRCVPQERAVELTASAPPPRYPNPRAGPASPEALYALEISSRQAWARYPSTRAADGLVQASAPAGDAFLDRLASQGFTVRVNRGVTQIPPGGEPVAALLRRCRT